MKLKYLLALPLFATAFAACDDIEYSDAQPAENPQLPLIEASDFSVTPSSALTSGLNLTTLESAAGDEAANYMVELYTVNVNTELPGTDTYVTGGFELSATDDFTEVIDVEGLEFNNGVATVPLASLLTARATMYGKDPSTMTVYYRIPLYVNYEGGEYRLGSSGYYYCDGDSFAETGTDPGYTVEDSYYILGPDGTSLADAIEFEHGEGSVWDNPVFTVRIDTSADFTWVIVPQSAYTAAAGTGSVDNAQVYGPATATALEGTLVLGNAAGTMTAGKYDVTIDLSTLSYSFEAVLVPEWLGTPNDSQGWDAGESQHLTLYGDATFLGYAWFGGEWGGKITTDKGVWCGVDEPVELDEETGVYSGTLIVDGGGNILEGEPAELYYFDVNWLTLEFTMTPINTIGLVGGFNGWNADEPEVLTPSADKLTWTGTVTFGEATEFKFIANTGWDIELGNSNGDLVCKGGGNISAEAGTYTVTVDLTALPYTLTMTAK